MLQIVIVPTIKDEADAVQAAIDFGTIASQNAPPGHAIFGAIASAKTTLAGIQAQIPWWSLTGGDAPAATVTTADAAVSAIYDAAAAITTDPDAPLPQTVAPAPQGYTFGWESALLGAGAIALIVYFHYAKGRR